MKRPVVVAIALGLSVIMSLMFLMYAFVQKAEAEKQFMRAKQESLNAERCARAMDQSRIEIEKTRYELTEALKLLEEKTKAETK